MIKTILIIDDDLAILDVLQQVLMYAGFNVITTSEADAVTEMIRKCQPDLVLIDHLLHNANGGAICKHIKNSVQFLHIPVLLMSAYSPVVNLLSYYQCDDFLAKPFDIWELIDKICSLCVKQIDIATAS